MTSLHGKTVARWQDDRRQPGIRGHLVTLSPCHLVICVLAALLTSGCVTTGPLEWVQNGFKVGPNYRKPTAPVADEWIEAKNPNVQNRHLQDWWGVFNDPTLNLLIVKSYEQNLNLRVLATRVLQARAQRAIAAGNLFPQSQDATGLYSNGTLGGGPGSIGFAGFNLSWELDLWGRFRRNVETGTANLDASVENYDDALVTLLADVATNYVQYRVAQQRIKIARANVKIQEDILSLVEQQFKVGINKVTKLDVDQARTALEQTRSSIPALQIMVGQANDTLCVLLGTPPRDLEPALGPGPDLDAGPVPTTPVWVAVGIPADLLRRRPDVRSAERQVAAQNAQIGVAEAALYPAVAVNGIIGFEDINAAPIVVSKGFLGFVTPSVTWNILNYGRIRNNVRLQEARTQDLIFTYQNKVLAAAREVQVPLRGFLRSREQAENLARSVTAATGALDIGRDQYRVGTIPFNTVFNLETTRVQQQDNLAVVQGNIALNLINVYRALGGGWELRTRKDCHADAPKIETPEQGGEVAPTQNVMQLPQLGVPQPE